jgi:beta-ribofuranosylaminobenzene 5'-phosphate synthase
MILGVRAFSRLHFGLMEISPGQPHCYGGVGIMIDSPASVIECHQGAVADPGAVSFEGDPYWRDRSEQALHAWQRHHEGEPIPIHSLRAVAPPQAHIGLGSGTQWACSIAGLLHAASPSTASPSTASPWSQHFPSARSLALQAGRGLRSHIGTEGFRSGGMIVDWGQNQNAREEPEPSRTQVESFPESWRIVTRCDRTVQGESGASEIKLFQSGQVTPNPNRNEMVRLIREEMLPAIEASDWGTASRSIGRYGQLAGTIFEPFQGGIYSSPIIAQCIDRLRGLGVYGSGQSSWGPTVFAIAQDEDQAYWVADAMRSVSEVDAVIEIAKVAPPALFYVSDSFSKCR